MYYTGGMSNQPVYRRPRSHAYSCRCPACAPKGDFVARNGILGPGFAILCLVAVIGFWPAMVWHGYTDTGGWQWDVHSTIAEAVYFGIFAFIALLCWADHKPPRTARPPRGRLNVEAGPPSGPDPAVTARLLLDLDDADGYMGEIDRAWSAESLDYLQRNGKLPDGWPFRGPRRTGGPR